MHVFIPLWFVYGVGAAALIVPAILFFLLRWAGNVLWEEPTGHPEEDNGTVLGGIHGYRAADPVQLRH